MTFKPYVLQNLPAQEVTTLSTIRKILEEMPNVDLGNDDYGEPIELSCHMLARAIGRIFKLKVRDGLWGGVYNHSWLETANGNIIDVYPVAVLGGPILMDGFVARRFYKGARHRYNGWFSQKSFVRSVDLIKNELARTMAQLGIQANPAKSIAGFLFDRIIIIL